MSQICYEAPISLDIESALITDFCKAPPMTCVAFAMLDPENPKFVATELVHVVDAYDILYDILRQERIVGHNIAFDMCVIANEFPELMPIIFEAYREHRITDTMLREKLQHIGIGVLRGFVNKQGKSVKIVYDLAACLLRRLDIKLEKDVWQKLYGPLREKPIEEWPQGAKDYPKDDVLGTLALWADQELEGKEFLIDEYHQTKYAFWMQLMSCWGFTTDPEGVAAFRDEIYKEQEDIAEDLIEVGLLRPRNKKGKYVRNVKSTQDYVKSVCQQKGLPLVMTKPSRTYPDGQIKIDADTLELTGDPILLKYAKLSSIKKRIDHDVPLLERGRVHVKWDLLKTGRTSTSPNTQNLPRKGGQRECFVPRPKWLFIAADYEGFELRSMAQLCYSILGWSTLRDALNNGIDAHLEVARRILNISYEEALARKKAGDDELDQVRQSSKIADFGFPGGLGIENFIHYARKQYGVIITEDQARMLKRYWQEAWPEFKEYHSWVNQQVNTGGVFTCLFSKRIMGRCSFTEAANGLYQALAADAAKNAGFLIAYACYVDRDSPLFGSRMVNFPHDEFIGETEDNDNAHDAAMELGRLMEVGASPYLPDVPPIAEPYIMRRWSKKAKPVFGADGRLIPWEPKIAA